MVTESTRTLSMDTHYPDSVDDFDEIMDDLDEEAALHHQQLVAQALQIENEFWNSEKHPPDWMTKNFDKIRHLLQSTGWCYRKQ